MTSGLLLIVQLLDSVLYNHVICFKASFLWDVTQCVLVVVYQCFGTGCGLIFKGQAIQELLHNVTEE